MSSKAYKELKCIATCHTGVSGGSDDNIINQFVHTVYRWYLAGMGDDHRDRFMELLPELTDTEWAKIMLNFVTSVNVPVGTPLSKRGDRRMSWVYDLDTLRAFS